MNGHSRKSGGSVVNSDDALVRQCLKGERQAYDILVRKYQSAAFGLAFSFVRNADDAAELVQEAFIRVYTHLEQLKEPAKFGGWFRTIVANRAKKWHRQKREQVALMSVAEELGQKATQQFEQNEYRLSIWEQVHNLDEIYRVPVTLFYGSGLSYEEIASFLDVPISTVRGRLQKARQQLKDVLAEDLNMKPVDVADQVQEEICKIARAEVYQEIDTQKHKHLALFMDIPGKVKVVRGEGNQVVIRGHKVAVGKDEDQAQLALQNMKLLHDEVDDWVAEGQHKGERFAGTNSTNEIPEAIVRQSGGKIKEFSQEFQQFYSAVYPEDIFPEMAPPIALLQSIRQSFPKAAHRVSMVFEKVIDVVLPKSVLNDDVLEGVWVNNSSGERIHGPVGRAVLEVAVPPGVSVMLQGVMGGAVSGVEGNVLMIGCDMRLVRSVVGNTFLLKTFAKKIEEMIGELTIFEHSYPHDKGEEKTCTARSMQICNVSGSLDLNMGYAHLEIEGVEKNITINNRLGNTILAMRKWAEEATCRIKSVSGDICVQIAKDILKQRSIAGAILVGTMNNKRIHDVIPAFQQANNRQMRYFSTVTGSNDHWRDADIFLSSESGHLEVKHFGD